MHRRDFLARTGLTAVVAPLSGVRATAHAEAGFQTSGPTSPGPRAGEWIPLWNGRNLDGFYTMLQRSGKGVAETKGMVTIENGLLHIMGNEVTGTPVESGYIATNDEYENVRIRVEYKWGVKRFPPRLENKRDNGILYYLVGADRVWPTCVECQIQETDVGDYFMVSGVRGIQGVLPGYGGAGTMPTEPTTGRKIKDGDFENRDGWNVVEVIARGDRSTHLVNGRIVNLASKIEQPDPDHAGQFIPLTRGKIAIEIEYAEIWYRRIEIMHLA